VAESADLVRWRRISEEPIVTPDPALYKTLAEDVTASETWRDPFVFADPDGDGWHMLITARAVGAARSDDGVLAHARSDDLRQWRLGPPLCAPGAGFGQLEVPQLRSIDGRQVLVFTCHPDEQTPERRARHGRASTWYVVGDSPLGPWDMATAQPFRDDPWLFAAPLVQDRAGTWNFLGFRNLEPEGILAFEIVDPIPVELRDGQLRALAPVPTYDLDARRLLPPDWPREQCRVTTL
jgi:beta-fructofuranosidase